MSRERFIPPAWIASGSVRGGSGISTFSKDLAKTIDGQLITSHARRTMANMWEEHLALGGIQVKNDVPLLWTSFVQRIYYAFLKSPEVLNDLLMEYVTLETSEQSLANFNTMQKAHPTVMGVRTESIIYTGFLKAIPDLLRDFDLLNAINTLKNPPVADGKLAPLSPRLAKERMRLFPHVGYLRNLIPPEDNLQIVFTVDTRVGSIRMLKRDLGKGSIKITYEVAKEPGSDEKVLREIHSEYVVGYLETGELPPGFTKAGIDEILEPYIQDYIKSSDARFEGDQTGFKELGVDFPQDLFLPARNKSVLETSNLKREETFTAAVREMNHTMRGFASYVFNHKNKD